MSKRIPLTQGKFAIVDDDDYEWLKQWKWCLSKSGYAVRGTNCKPKQKIVFMHRQIMNVLLGMQVDHKNHTRLDNRKSNLRLCTGNDNRINRIKGGIQKYKVTH